MKKLINIFILTGLLTTTIVPIQATVADGLYNALTSRTALALYVIVGFIIIRKLVVEHRNEKIRRRLAEREDNLQQSLRQAQQNVQEDLRFLGDIVEQVAEIIDQDLMIQRFNQDIEQGMANAIQRIRTTNCDSNGGSVAA